jgi:glycerol-3-phosphate dehydrogenase
MADSGDLWSTVGCHRRGGLAVATIRPMPFGSFDRARNLDLLGEGTYDLVVVGGGITGAGVALDAAARGLRTALIERADFGSGTSSRSSKMVHGGLRYLQSGDVRLVYQALRERQRLLDNAPHLVRVLPFLIPILSGRGGVIPRRVARALGTAMWAYDLTGGLRIGKRHKRLGHDAALAHMPTLDPERLAWAYLYYDAYADDARLTLAVVRTAALDHGAVAVNHARVTGFRKERSHAASASLGGEDGLITGVQVRADEGTEVEVRTHTVVNAAGVWTDSVRALDEGQDPQSIRPAKGIHITVPWRKVRNDIAAVLPVRHDRRSIFIVPWPAPDGTYGGEDGFSYVGTTDTDYDGDLDDPQCTSDDVDYLLDALNGALAEPLDRSDVLGTWAGLRPLIREDADQRTADLSRRHHVNVSDAGLITITGGKLTTYREMSRDAVNTAVDRLADLGQRGIGRSRIERRLRRSPTAKLPLRGAEGWENENDRDPHLAERYGSEARVVRAMIEADPTLGEPMLPGLPYRKAEAVYAARYEMATTLDDVMTRRTRARLLGRDATAGANASDVADLVGDELGWSAEEREAQVDAYRRELEHERNAPGLPETALLAGPPETR